MLGGAEEETIMAVNDAKFWDRAARKYAASPIADMEGYERTLEETRRYLKSGDSVLEIGCGTGTTALRLAPSVARYHATDVSSEMIAIAREKAAAEGRQNVTFETSTIDGLDAPEASFDAVLGFNILHLVNGRDRAYRAAQRLLKSGGVFISKTPILKEFNPLFRVAVPLMQAVGQAPYVAFLSAEELEREIAATGFEIVERARHGSGRKDRRVFLVARKR